MVIEKEGRKITSESYRESQQQAEKTFAFPIASRLI